MAQLAIYLDDGTVELLDHAAKRDGLSRSAWVKQAIRVALRNRLPESFFEVLGTWDDTRSPEQILEDMRGYADDSSRARLE